MRAGSTTVSNSTLVGSGTVDQFWRMVLMELSLNLAAVVNFTEEI
ncbi:MAG: hypothetical protein R2788_12340 [Saprospiraceae bacterium]